MLTKKPLNEVSCLACDKRIPDHRGTLPDFKVWKKLPKHDHEKQAKFGPGYSKILQKMKERTHLMIRPEAMIINSRLFTIIQALRSYRQFSYQMNIQVRLSIICLMNRRCLRLSKITATISFLR
jgi:hypothetical protein